MGVTFASLATDNGMRCLMIDKRLHLWGNVYGENVDGVNVHSIVLISFTLPTREWGVCQSICIIQLLFIDDYG